MDVLRRVIHFLTHAVSCLNTSRQEGSCSIPSFIDTVEFRSHPGSAHLFLTSSDPTFSLQSLAREHSVANRTLLSVILVLQYPPRKGLSLVVHHSSTTSSDSVFNCSS